MKEDEVSPEEDNFNYVFISVDLAGDYRNGCKTSNDDVSNRIMEFQSSRVTCPDESPSAVNDIQENTGVIHGNNNEEDMKLERSFYDNLYEMLSLNDMSLNDK